VKNILNKKKKFIKALLKEKRKKKINIIKNIILRKKIL